MLRAVRPACSTTILVAIFAVSAWAGACGPCSGKAGGKAGAEPGPSTPAGPACANAGGIPKVDAHTHIGPGTETRMLALMDEWGISRSINVSGGWGQDVDLSSATREATGGRIRFFCNMDLSSWGTESFARTAIADLERCRAMGGEGLKIFKGLGLKLTNADGSLVRVDDPVLDPVFEKAGDLGMPVLIHTGDPKAFFEKCDEKNERHAELAEHPSWCFHGKGYPSWSDLFSQYEARVARHPGTVFIGAHFGNDPEDPERVFGMLDEHPNLYVDTSARVPEIGRFDPGRMHELFVSHADRIVFGTDVGIDEGMLALGSGPPYKPVQKEISRFFLSTWRYFETWDRDFEHPTPIQGDWKISGIGLPCDVLEKVYHANIERILAAVAVTARPDGGGAEVGEPGG